MRFCDFFAEYKIRMKGMKSTINLKEQPRYRLVLFGLFIIFIVLTAVLELLELFLPALLANLSAWTFIVSIFLVVVMARIDSKEENVERMLKEHYKPYSERRMMELIKLLREYHVEITETEKLDLLIHEACKNKEKYAPWAEIQMSWRVTGAVALPLASIIFKKIVESFNTTDYTMLIITAATLVFCIYAIVFVMFAIFKDFIYSDGKFYDSLVDDINQLKIFGNYSSDLLLII